MKDSGGKPKIGLIAVTMIFKRPNCFMISEGTQTQLPTPFSKRSPFTCRSLIFVKKQQNIIWKTVILLVRLLSIAGKKSGQTWN